MILRKELPGLSLLLGIALFSLLARAFLPAYVSGVFIAVLAGILVRNIFRPDEKIFGPGISLGLNRLLKAAIILLGAGVGFDEVARLGLPGLIVIWAVIGASFIVTFLLGAKMGVSLRKKILVAVGLGICGNTAVVVTAPLVEAGEDDVFLAVSIVTVSGVLAVFAYPVLGMSLGLSETFFGAWAGTAVNDTSQVVAAGFAFGEQAGRTATVIKLARNVMMAPVVLMTGFLYRKKTGTGPTAVGRAGFFPLFIVGFVFLALLNTLGFVPAAAGRAADAAARFLVLVALSGIGLGVDIARLRRIGPRPFLVGLATALCIAAVSYWLNSLFLVG